MGKHDDRNKDEEERKQQGNGQVARGTQISRDDPEGRHSKRDDEDDK